MGSRVLLVSPKMPRKKSRASSPLGLSFGRLNLQRVFFIASRLLNCSGSRPCSFRRSETVSNLRALIRAAVWTR